MRDGGMRRMRSKLARSRLSAIIEGRKARARGEQSSVGFRAGQQIGAWAWAGATTDVAASLTERPPTQNTRQYGSGSATSSRTQGVAKRPAASLCRQTVIRFHSCSLAAHAHAQISLACAQSLSRRWHSESLRMGRQNPSTKKQRLLSSITASDNHLHRRLSRQAAKGQIPSNRRRALIPPKCVHGRRRLPLDHQSGGITPRIRQRRHMEAHDEPEDRPQRASALS